MKTTMMHNAGYKVEFRNRGRWHSRTVYVDDEGCEYVRNPQDCDGYMWLLSTLCLVYPTRKVMTTDRLDYLKYLFETFYQELCQSGNADPDYGWYLAKGDELIGACDPQLNAFNIHRKDVLGSDREVVAYVKACEYVGWL